ncbi:MAG TPA: branched-chain amino acid ABC transporter permease [Anaerolineae bacterium]|nr:branched-chain amino acid ABC transporter permease [Anaerolineae bacterium]
MEIFLEQLLNGLTLGAMYACIAVGQALIFGVARLINFAHGDIFMVGAYVFFIAFGIVGLPYPVAVIVTVVVMFAFGGLFERLIVRPIIDKPWHVHLLATLGASIVLANASVLIWGTTPKEVPTPFSQAIVEIAGFRISVQRIIVLGISLLAFYALHLFLEKTRTGKAMKAMSQNRDACAVVGIDIRRMSALTFALSCALLGLAGSVVSPLFNIHPTMGFGLTFKAFAAVIMGGFGQVNGAIYGAFILGLTEALAAGYVASDYKDAMAFAVMVVVLLVRPQGLFGRKVGL